MPISRERAREIVQRNVGGRELLTIKQGLSPVPVEDRPLPPRVPAGSEWSAEALRERREFLAGLGVQTPALAGEASVDPESLRGNIEHYIGMAQVPVGLIGPLRLAGLHARGDVYVPLATSEGALVASYDRGARLISRAGGAVCLLTQEQVQRAPGFAFESLADAAHFAVWAVDQIEAFREVTGAHTRHGQLIDMMTHVEGNHVYLIFAFHPGDAAGQNMVTFCSAAICKDILERTPIQPSYWFLESNMSGDKKATAMSFLQTRGRNVTAEVLLPRRLVLRGLRTTPERMVDYWRMSFVAGVQTGSIGVSGHIANGLAAVFLACGQDVACVSEASVGTTRMECRGGDLYCALTLPNLIVGTVGGGTGLPTARECLAILDCVGDGKAGRLAEICAATALAGEISIVGALCANEFADAHRRLGRKSPS
ncbi:MAG TPA: hydroxymethylglutaryl-CoA reductase [Longimicrobium sp.]|nr:hydroxymethylglutaryl-CoA reductase [Longimicrobium sp.]